MNHYHINVFYSTADRCYVADIPDLKFCSAFGATPEEAVREVELAKAAWLATARKRGKPIPRPKYRLTQLSGAPLAAPRAPRKESKAPRKTRT